VKAARPVWSVVTRSPPVNSTTAPGIRRPAASSTASVARCPATNFVASRIVAPGAKLAGFVGRFAGAFPCALRGTVSPAPGGVCPCVDPGAVACTVHVARAAVFGGSCAVATQADSTAVHTAAATRSLRANLLARTTIWMQILPARIMFPILSLLGSLCMYTAYTVLPRPSSFCRHAGQPFPCPRH